MYSNTSSLVLLTLETLGLSNAYVYPAFLLGTLMYLFIMFCNLLILATITLTKKLHKPMFILLINLSVSDMLGATAFFPQFVFNIVTKNRQISYPACNTQAFLVHVYGTGNLLILSAMAYDRYIAICCPLRYTAIMTPHNLVKMIILIWLINFSLMTTSILLLIQFKICRTKIVDLYCNMPSLLKLVCEDTGVYSTYGLFTIVFCQGGPLSILIYTYAQILRTCVMNNQSGARQKAIQTCGSHLVVYLILELSSLIAQISHRVEGMSPSLRRALGASALVFPPFLDPIVYGLKNKELKQSIKMFLKRNVG